MTDQKFGVPAELRHLAETTIGQAEKVVRLAAREKSESIRRLRKLARKQAIREGLIAAPVRKRDIKGKGGKGSSAATSASRVENVGPQTG